MCSGKMRRYMEEHRWRRRPSGLDSDTEARKRGEQIGLDTLVVHAVNDEHSVLGDSVSAAVNAISSPPGEYARKCETQRN